MPGALLYAEDILLNKQLWPHPHGIYSKKKLEESIWDSFSCFS